MKTDPPFMEDLFLVHVNGFLTKMFFVKSIYRLCVDGLIITIRRVSRELCHKSVQYYAFQQQFYTH